MKRIAACVLCLLLLLSLCGCGGKEKAVPEDTVIGFSDAMRTLDAEAMRECLLNPQSDEFLADLDFGDSESEEDTFIQLLNTKAQKWAKELQYDIVKVERDGDRAQATVKYTYVDTNPIIQEVIREIFARVYDGSLDYLSDDDAEDLLELMVKEKLVTTPVEKTERIIQYSLVLVNGEWKIIDLPSEVYDIVTLNLYSAMEELELLFGDGTAAITTNGTDTPEPVPEATPVPEPTPAPAPAADTPFDIAKKYIDRPLDELTAVIGEPLSSAYGPSCLIAGAQDGQLQYDGFWVYTLKDGNTETVKDVLEGVL